MPTFAEAVISQGIRLRHALQRWKRRAQARTEPCAMKRGTRPVSAETISRINPAQSHVTALTNDRSAHEIRCRQEVQMSVPNCAGYKPFVVLAALLTAFIVLQFSIPLGTTVQIGADEGFELAKATLCLKGYQLYTEIWNDQPPLHTFLITKVLKHVSPSILGPRLVTSVFTVLLLAAIFFISLRGSGLRVATLTTGLLIASPGFVELSSSC